MQPKFGPITIITTSGVAVGVALVMPILVGICQRKKSSWLSQTGKESEGEEKKIKGFYAICFLCLTLPPPPIWKKENTTTVTHGHLVHPGEGGGRKGWLRLSYDIFFKKRSFAPTLYWQIRPCFWKSFCSGHPCPCMATSTIFRPEGGGGRVLKEKPPLLLPLEREKKKKKQTETEMPPTSFSLYFFH